MTRASIGTSSGIRTAPDDAEKRYRAAYEALLGPLADVTARLSQAETGLDRAARDFAAARAEHSAEMAQVAAVHASEIAQLKGELDTVYRSTSWRITAPLRSAGRPVIGFKSALQRCAGRVSCFVKGIAPWCRNAVVRSANLGLDALTTLAAGWRRRFGTPRTMWGVTPILTLPLLAQCDRLLGLRSDSLVFTTYYITNSFDINLKRLCEYIYTKHPSWTIRLHKIILRIALIRYDVFHLFCDRSVVLPTRRMEINEDEMKAIVAFDKRLYTYTYGADVRTRQATLSLGRYNLCAECPQPGQFCMCDDTEGSGNIGRIGKYATEMLAMGDMLAYVPGATNLHFWPLDLAKFHYCGSNWTKDRPLRVAHAPNHPHFKGTQYLIDAVERLQSEGFAIELVRVQGVPNTEVIRLFETCDLIADQFIAGFHGYTALEAMALGKPVLCYLRGPDMALDPVNCPIINAWPDTVYATLKRCLEGQLDLAELGRRSRSYVEHYYSLDAVASRLGVMYLRSARFPDRINRRIEQRLSEIQNRLPELLTGPPPVPWHLAEEVDVETARGADSTCKEVLS
ncbi:hypothetical protein [Microvirga sp. 2TAF3]|uniref:hypothetical protein n=1 Tax=Microvirga sp. 2TAF3 TaxID=3233014 RepID=UPI003F9E84C1